MSENYEKLRKQYDDMTARAGHKSLAKIAAIISKYFPERRHHFCSCGGALTAEGYIEHYFEKGHDRGEANGV